jgi:uncharacterized protein with GYD domain
MFDVGRSMFDVQSFHRSGQAEAHKKFHKRWPGLINTDPSKTRNAYEKLKSLEGVANITAVFGRFDLVVMIRALDLAAGSKLISKIRNVDGVTATETLIAMTFESLLLRNSTQPFTSASKQFYRYKQ